MIKLELLPKPERLTDKLVQTKTLKFKKTKEIVLDMRWLRKAISNLSFDKCCFSEIRLGEESKYMEVEHFFPKELYPDEVMQWGNMLPVCKKCNVTKGTHDTKAQPIVNPFIDNPKDYFYLENSRYCVRNHIEKARMTLNILGLNDMEHFIVPRSQVKEITENQLELLKDSLLRDDDKFDVYLLKLKRLMGTGNREKEYSAMVSTTILSDSNYKAMEQWLKEGNRWGDELESLKEELDFCSLVR